MKHLTLPALLCTAALLLTACAQPAASSVPESASSAVVSSKAETSSAPADTDTLQPIEIAMKDYLRTSGSVNDLTGTRIPVEEVIALDTGIAFRSPSGFARAYVLAQDSGKAQWMESSYMGIPWRATALPLTDTLTVYQTEPTFDLHPDYGNRPDINYDTVLTDMGDFDINIFRLLLLVHFGVCGSNDAMVSDDTVRIGEHAYAAFFDGELVKGLYTEAGWEQVIHLHDQDNYAAEPHIIEQNGKVYRAFGPDAGEYVSISNLQITHVSDTKRVYRFESNAVMHGSADIAPGFTLEITAVRQRTKADEKLNNWLWKIDGFQITQTPLNEQLSNY